MLPPGLEKALGSLVFGQAVQIAMVETEATLREARAALSHVHEEKWRAKPVDMTTVLDLAQDIINRINDKRSLG